MKKIIVSVLIISIILLNFPLTLAATGSFRPEDSTDDAWINRLGKYFGEADFIPLRDPNHQMISGLRFPNITIPQDAKINNATIYVYSPYNYDYANVSATIYGIDEDNARSFNESADLTRPYTTSYTNWNTSLMNTPGWYNVSVTEQVQEIISRVNWGSGNALGFIILATQGLPYREFLSYDGIYALRPILNITWAIPPIDPSAGATPPYNDTSIYEWLFWYTYRGLDVWNITAANRTGRGLDINWETLNMTALTEADPGGTITRNNNTWTTLSNIRGDGQDKLYNDTGVLDKMSFFVRFALNITQVVNTGAGYAPAFEIGVGTPNQGGGAAGGSNVFLEIWPNGNDFDWRFYVRVEDAGADFTAWAGDVLNESTGMIYVEFYVNDEGGTNNYFSYDVYSDPNFSISLFGRADTHANVEGPWQYAYIATSYQLAGITGRASGEIYTFLEPIEINATHLITYPNGTFTNGPYPDPDEIEEIIDELLGGAQPEDPLTPDWGEHLTRFRFKLFILMVGIAMIFGSPIAGVYRRPSIATWIMILFVMFFGLGLLWSLSSM